MPTAQEMPLSLLWMSNAIGSSFAGFKFKNITFSSGTLSTDSFISVSTGDLTIKNGAKLISSRSSTSGVIGNSTTAICGVVTIEPGGIFELTGCSTNNKLYCFL